MGRSLDITPRHRELAELQSEETRQNGCLSQWFHLRCEYFCPCARLAPLFHHIKSSDLVPGDGPCLRLPRRRNNLILYDYGS